MVEVMAEGSLVEGAEVVEPDIVEVAVVAELEGGVGDAVVVDCRHSYQPTLG